MITQEIICLQNCMNPVTGIGCKSGVSGKVLLFSDMLSVDGDADAAVETRIRIGWNKFRQLVSLTERKGDCTAVVCEVVCCMEERHGL